MGVVWNTYMIAYMYMYPTELSCAYPGKAHDYHTNDTAAGFLSLKVHTGS